MTTNAQAVSGTAVVQEPKRRGRRATAASAGTFSFYDGALSPDSEIDAQKSCARSGKPYLKIETLRVEFVVLDGKLVAVATPAKKQ
jgi:hypothetical protein